MKKFGGLCKRIFTFIITSPAALGAIAAAVIMMLALFVYPVIGMADNGDFYRSINGNGIYKLDRYESDQYFSYFSSKYGVYQYFDEYEDSLFSVQNLYIKAALLLNQIFGSEDTIFDIRFLAVILVIQLVIGIYLLVDYMSYQKSFAQGIILSAICVLMFADTAYTAYFNSFYTEGIVYVSTLLLTASALLLSQKRYSSGLLLASVLFHGGILIFTKQQNVTVALPLFLLCIGIAFLFGIKNRIVKKMAVLGAMGLFVCGVLMYLMIPGESVMINQYHAMTRGTMITAENPEEMLLEFGIDGQFSILEGTTYFQRYPEADLKSSQIEEGFFEKYNAVSLSVYYLTHPGELVTMLDKAFHSGYMIRPSAQGNYERKVNKEPGAKTNFFTLYSHFKKRVVPNTVGYFVILLSVIIVMNLKHKSKLVILLCVVLIGVIQMGTSIVGAGDADLSRHVFSYNISYDIMTYVCMAPILTRFFMHMSGGFFSRFSKSKKQAGCILLFVLFFLSPMSAQGAETLENQKTIAIAADVDSKTDVPRQIAEALGIKVVSEEEADVPTIWIGGKENEAEGIIYSSYQNRSVSFSLESYTGTPTFLEEVTVIEEAKENTFGRISFGNEQEAPFAAADGNGNYYVPCYASKNAAANVLLASLMQKILSMKGAGWTYFLLDEVYVFSDLTKIINWVDCLNEQGIPFLIRVMPVYENLDYPAFLRFTEVLCYAQSMGGTVVIHEPLVEEYYAKEESPEEKVYPFEEALTREGVKVRTLTAEPFLQSLEELAQLTSSSKNFENLPFDTMIGVTPEETEEEFQRIISSVNEKWMSFSNLSQQYENTSYLYQEKEIPSDFFIEQTEEGEFAAFFHASDRVLVGIVGSSLVIFSIFLLIGRRWYRRKFFK